MSLKRQQASTPFNPSAGTWNTFCTVSEQFLANKHRPGRNSSSYPKQNTIVFVQNATGGDLDRFYAVKLDEPLVSPDDNENEFFNSLVFAAKSLSGDEAETIAVIQEPLASDKIGKAAVAGLTVARIEITDADHQYAAYSDDHPTYPTSAKSGSIKIVWKQSGTGDRWAIVFLGMEQAGGGLRCNATMAAAMTDSSTTGTVDNVECTDGGTFDTSHPDYNSSSSVLTVYNLFAWEADDGAVCKIELNLAQDSINGTSGDGMGRWELYQVKCPE